MKTEKVKLIDGSEREIEINELMSTETLYRIVDESSFVQRGEDGNPVPQVNAGKLVLLIMKHQIKGATPEEIEAHEGHRIFEKYFQKYINLVGGNTDPLPITDGKSGN